MSVVKKPTLEMFVNVLTAAELFAAGLSHHKQSYLADVFRTTPVHPIETMGRATTAFVSSVVDLTSRKKPE